jgi:hypothetical protein
MSAFHTSVMAPATRLLQGGFRQPPQNKPPRAPASPVMRTAGRAMAKRGLPGTPKEWLNDTLYRGIDDRLYSIEGEGPGGISVGVETPAKARMGGPNRGAAIRRNMRLNAGGGAPRPGGGGGGGGSMVDDLFGTMDEEMDRLQGAADRQYGRNQGQIDAFGEFLGGVEGDIMGTAEQGAAGLEGEAGNLAALGDQAVDEFGRQRSRVEGQLDQDLGGVFDAADAASGAADEAMGFAYRAEGSARGAVSGYDAASEANVSNAVAGLERRTSQQRQMIERGLNPDGTMMSPAERQAATRQLQYDTNVAVGETVTQIRDQQQQTLAGLRMQLANVQLGGGQIALGAAAAQTEAGRLRQGAAESRAQVGIALNAQGLDAERIRQGYRGVGASLMTTASEMRNAARALATQLEMSGRTALADMVRNNPETVVSRFNAMLTMYGVLSAPGARSVPGRSR